MIKKYTFLLSFLLACLVTSSVLPAQAQVGQTQVAKYMEEAKAYMAEENYTEANLVFRRMLSLNTTLPEDMSYLFAETLFMLGQYTNSQNFLTKYLTMTGRMGNYYSDALTLQEALEKEVRAVTNCQYCNGAGFRLVACLTCQFELWP